MLAPILVELRVVFGWFGIELTVVQTVLIGLGLVTAVLVWAFLPESADEEPTAGNESSPGHDRSRAD